MKFFGRYLLGVLALSLALLPAGCVKDNSDPSLAAHVERGKEKQKAQNDLNQIAQYYQLYNTENGRVPNAKQLKDYIKQDPNASKLSKALDEGHLVLNDSPPNLGARVVVAYEKEKDLRGNRVVVLADASVHTMDENEFQAALKGK
ncbi:MAG TPA: hypothetical protein VG013_38705 [Gemmataceae bacterium]|jgi:type II secretory pathway pseudopilin PulG|nr:hypothetical protein [Gemmataceae bacterium]